MEQYHLAQFAVLLQINITQSDRKRTSTSGKGGAKLSDSVHFFLSKHILYESSQKLPRPEVDNGAHLYFSSAILPARGQKSRRERSAVDFARPGCNHAKQRCAEVAAAEQNEAGDPGCSALAMIERNTGATRDVTPERLWTRANSADCRVTRYPKECLKPLFKRAVSRTAHSVHFPSPLPSRTWVFGFFEVWASSLLFWFSRSFSIPNSGRSC